MNRLFPNLLVVLAILAAVPAEAQSLQTYGVKGGLSLAKHGGAFADLVQDVGGDLKWRAGITLGGFAIVALNDQFQAQVELLYAQKGVKYSGQGLRERILKASYLDIPILGRAGFEAGDNQFFAVAGPVLSLRTSAKGEVDGNEFDTKDEVKGTDLGLAMGGGVTFGKIDVEARYTHGLANVSKSSDSDEAAKNRFIAVMVGYTLGGPGLVARRNR